MKIRIKETGELKELVIRDTETNVEWTNDLLGNHDATDYNKETEEYEMSNDDFEWWNEYITNHKKDGAEIEYVADQLGIDKSEIYEAIQENITNDLGDEHSIKQSVLFDFVHRVK